MKKKLKKLYLYQKKYYTNRIVGTKDKPRFSVFKSNKHIYAQLIDDKNGHTMIFFSTLNKLFKNEINLLSKKDSSYLVGKYLAIEARKNNITKVIFDRGIFPYHGCIKCVAEGARAYGLFF